MKLPTELYHYSNKHIEKLLIGFYEDYKKNIWYDPYHKPCGLWFSVEDYEDDQNWKTWCEGGSFRIEELNFKHRIVLNPHAKILFLTTSQEIRSFGHQYDHNNPVDFDRRSVFGKNNPYINAIKWEEVQKQYDGIIIAPYNWECRILSETIWYYGWDCSSGCVWNMAAIDEFTLCTEPQLV